MAPSRFWIRYLRALSVLFFAQSCYWAVSGAFDPLGIYDRALARTRDAEVRKRQAAGSESTEFGPGDDEDIATFYQRFHNQQIDEGLKPGREKLTEDGVAGDKTRKELISDYMALGGLGWTAIKDLPLTIEVHGCGENFPLDGTGLELDTRAVSERDGERDRVDRRVELFFFDSTFKVAPAITGPARQPRPTSSTPATATKP